MKYKYIFGPVPSRRLGMSLGIDLVPKKICTFDCIYCECGKTTDKTINRKEFFPLNDILNEIKHYLNNNDFPDFITFSGNGEPLLYSGIDNIITFIKNNYPNLKIALLTNSYFLTNKDIREAVKECDVVLPSLDSANQKTFEIIDRPYSTIKVENIINGLIEFRKEYKGEIWLEIFILPKINDNENEIMLLKQAINQIKPNRVQLNTLDRPGAEQNIEKVSKEMLEHIAMQLNYKNTEIISKYKSRKEIKSYKEDIENTILQTISRRPCTMEDLEEILGIKSMEINKYIDILIKEKKIEFYLQERGTFFKAV